MFHFCLSSWLPLLHRATCNSDAAETWGWPEALMETGETSQVEMEPFLESVIGDSDSGRDIPSELLIPRQGNLENPPVWSPSTSASTLMFPFAKNKGTTVWAGQTAWQSENWGFWLDPRISTPRSACPLHFSGEVSLAGVTQVEEVESQTEPVIIFSKLSAQPHLLAASIDIVTWTLGTSHLRSLNDHDSMVWYSLHRPILLFQPTFPTFHSRGIFQ